ncbi:MAG: SDR family oxidoreductase, partial [Deltaproteobacteria bacterium]|nr:SDR family oxidoreductase [Deltaproteobacteria bacterium]
NYLPEEEADAQEVKKYIEEAGRKAVLIPGDLADEDFCGHMVEKANAELGGLDIMALNAGRQIAVKSIEEIDTKQLHEVFAVNVFSLFWTIKAALPYLPEGASIITCASIEAYDPSKQLLDYSSTKGAIKAFTQSLAKQVAEKGIRVNCVAPGPIWTPLQVSGGQFEEKLPEFGHNTPMKRAGQPVELSGVYVLLASQESSYTTAEVYAVTGGNHL